jgi:hypothetical protein
MTANKEKPGQEKKKAWTTKRQVEAQHGNGKAQGKQSKARQRQRQGKVIRPVKARPGKEKRPAKGRHDPTKPSRQTQHIKEIEDHTNTNTTAQKIMMRQREESTKQQRKRQTIKRQSSKDKIDQSENISDQYSDW